MRYVSRVHHFGLDSDISATRQDHSSLPDEPELTAIRGLMVAASLSALFWGACFTAIWFLRLRN